MSDVKKAMELISGNKPTPDQVNRVMALAHSLDISERDALLPILIALDQYHGVFGDLPKNIRDAVNEAVKTAKITADAVVSDASKRVQIVVAGSLEPLAAKAFDDGVHKYIDQIDEQAFKKQRTNGLIWASIVMSVTLMAGMAGGYAWGSSQAEVAAAAVVASAVADKAAVAERLAAKDQEITKIKNDEAVSKTWAITPEGQLAYKFFKDGGGVIAAKCQGATWKIGKTAEGEKLCVPNVKAWVGWEDGTSGWIIP